MTNISTTVQEGYAPFKHAHQDYETWYRVVGDLSTSRPLVVLHGGPGTGHASMARCFDAYPALTHTAVVYYDQLGCGNSTHLPDKKGDESFWTPALFVAELDNLVRYLGIRSNFDLYGHSWGAKLAAKYAVSKEQEGSGLHKVVLSSGAANQNDLIRVVSDYIAALPTESQDVIHRCIAEGQEERHEYQLALWEFVKQRVSANIPRPNMGESVMAQFVPDDVVYSTMLGVDPFHIHQGSLRTFDMTQECKHIHQSVLLLSGELEDASAMQPFFDGIPRVKWFVFSGLAHAALADQPEKYREVVHSFLAA